MKRPYELLPIDFPCDYDPGPNYFYENFVSKFVPDSIRMMVAGLHVDAKAVDNLRVEVTNILEDSATTLNSNKLIKNYQSKRQSKFQKVHVAKATQAVREPSYYLQEYTGSMLHRTSVVNYYLDSIGCSSDKKEKWSVSDLKKYNIFKSDIFLNSIIEKTTSNNHKHVKAGMLKLAESKAELWNRPRYEKAKETAKLPPFNAGSPDQKKEFFELNKIEPLAFSKDTNEASWGRDQIIQVKKSLPDTEKELHEVLQCLIDCSFGSIIKNNFINAFDTFTIDGVMHGNIKLFGAKSFRNTSNSPNLLNMPSTKSIYAKPLKRCFVAPKGFVIYAIDLSALEDRVIANLTGDENKCNIFLEGLDGHSLNACGYFKDEVTELIGDCGGTVNQVKTFMMKVDEEIKAFVDLRQISKAPTFKLAYGGYPDSDKGGVITQEIFDNYHNILYPGITDYRENYVLKTAKQQGYLHLGLGCRIYTDNPDDDIRTLHNATVQFWSILTLIAINELNYRIDRDGLTGKVEVCSTIYDSIYIYVEESAETIKWVNDNAVELLCVQYLKEQIVDNEAKGEISNSWADMISLSNGASLEEIEAALDEVRKRK